MYDNNDQTYRLTVYGSMKISYSKTLSKTQNIIFHILCFFLVIA